MYLDFIGKYFLHSQKLLLKKNIEFSRNEGIFLGEFIFIFLILLQINIIFCGNCQNVENLLDSNCFNDLIIFNDSNWRAGHASTNNKNITIVAFKIGSEPEKSFNRSKMIYNNMGNNNYKIQEFDDKKKDPGYFTDLVVNAIIKVT